MFFTFFLCLFLFFTLKRGYNYTCLEETIKQEINKQFKIFFYGIKRNFFYKLKQQTQNSLKFVILA